MNKDLLYRILTALIAGALAVSAIIFSAYGIWLFCALVSVLSLWEFTRVTGIKSNRYVIPTLAGGIVIWLLHLYQLVGQDVGIIPLPENLLTGCMVLVFPVLAIFTLFNANEKEPIRVLGTLVLGFLYCYLPIFLLYKLSFTAPNSEYVYMIPLGILFLTWVLDSLAYFSGRFLGKHPLFPRISPKKTWEGAIGGAACCIGLGVVLLMYMPVANINWIIVSVIISVISQLGDLVESMFKRSVQLKDSGNILPGHGGMLDRFDGVFLSVPFIFLYFSTL